MKMKQTKALCNLWPQSKLKMRNFMILKIKKFASLQNCPNLNLPITRDKRKKKKTRKKFPTFITCEKAHLNWQN
jgi:hypothetical protein